MNFEVPDSFVEQVAERVAAILAEREPSEAVSSPYMSVGEAAEYLRCERQRIYDLVSARRLTRFKDGARVLVSRAEIEAHLARDVAGAVAPSTGRAA